jgi:bacteriocin-like protein
MERVMTTNFDHELTEAELEQVVGGAKAGSWHTTNKTVANIPPTE